MKILLINKFLHLNGGSETYVYQLGEYLKKQGHLVEYFGMDHENRCMGNQFGIYTKTMDFHTSKGWEKLTYSLKTIYSIEARKKIRRILCAFEPDVCHINNFNYQLTPSILLEIQKWRKETGRKCKIVFTAHDYQLLCPNHMFRCPSTHTNCEKCSSGNFYHCLKNRCVHNSFVKSLIGMTEGYFWKYKKVYQCLDTIICCSEFMKKKMEANSVLSVKTIAMHNFVKEVTRKEVEKKDYVLYFGRFSKEKGIETLVKVCKSLPEIPFVFAGAGPLESLLEEVPNIRNVGFQKADALERLIREALFSVYPSEWYENCPFSVMESQLYGTPVLGAKIGGIPELIENGVCGELFESGNKTELREKILEWWKDMEKLRQYQNACRKVEFDTVAQYCEKLISIYQKC